MPPVTTGTADDLPGPTGTFGDHILRLRTAAALASQTASDPKAAATLGDGAALQPKHAGFAVQPRGNSAAEAASDVGQSGSAATDASPPGRGENAGTSVKPASLQHGRTSKTGRSSQDAPPMMVATALASDDVAPTLPVPRDGNSAPSRSSQKQTAIPHAAESAGDSAGLLRRGADPPGNGTGVSPSQPVPAVAATPPASIEAPAGDVAPTGDGKADAVGERRSGQAMPAVTPRALTAGSASPAATAIAEPSSGTKDQQGPATATVPDASAAAATVAAAGTANGGRAAGSASGKAIATSMPTAAAAAAIATGSSIETSAGTGTGATSPARQLATALINLRRSSDGTQSVTLRLEPEEMGQVHISIEKPPDAGARVAITVERPETMGLLLRDQSQLQHALDQAGLPSTGRSVSLHVAPPDASAGNSAMRLDPGSGFGLGHNAWRDDRPTARHGTAATLDEAAPQGLDETHPLILGLRAGLDITA